MDRAGAICPGPEGALADRGRRQFDLPQHRRGIFRISWRVRALSGNRAALAERTPRLHARRRIETLHRPERSRRVPCARPARIPRNQRVDSVPLANAGPSAHRWSTLRPPLTPDRGGSISKPTSSPRVIISSAAPTSASEPAPASVRRRAPPAPVSLHLRRVAQINSASRAPTTRSIASSGVRAIAVRWPILRPGRGSDFPYT